MRQSEDVKAFKNELRNYLFYKRKITETLEAIDYHYHLLGGIKGVDPSHTPVHSPKNLDFEYDVRDKIESLNACLKRYEGKKKYLDSILCQMDEDICKATKSVYVDNRTFTSVCTEHFLSTTGLQKRINKEIAKALKKGL